MLITRMLIRIKQATAEAETKKNVSLVVALEKKSQDHQSHYDIDI